MNTRRFWSSSLAVILPATLILTVLGFAPITPNYFSPVKQFILIFSVVISAAVWIVSLVTANTAIRSRSRLTVPVILFILAMLANLFVNKEGWMEALSGRGSVFIAAALLTLIAVSLRSTAKVAIGLIYSLVFSGFLLALHGLLQLTVLYRLESLPDYMNVRAFTPSGSPLATLTILVIGAAAAFLYAIKALKGNRQYAFFVAGTVQTIAAVAYLSLMLPGGELAPSLLPYQASWSVTLDAMKSARSIFFGVGLANFSQLLNLVRPTSLNTTPLWNSLPPSASSELLQLLATAGVTGLSTFLLIPFAALSRTSEKNSVNSVLTAIALLSLAAMIFAPLNLPVLALFFISLGLLAHREENDARLPSAMSRWAVAGLVLAVAIAAGFYEGRLYLAEHHIFRAQAALAKNDGKTVYEEHLKAIRLVPRMTNYHLSYSQVNLSLASALSQKTDLSETERSQVTTLIQQAIREGKTAASLRPTDSRNWQNLGSIYRNLINVADGSDQYAISAYAQAVKLDPGNPVLRVELGGLLFQLAGTAKDQNTKNAYLSRAAQEFQTAIQLKPDYANGYYNLSKALEAAGNSQAAYAAMQKAIASLDPNSTELEKANAELKTLENKLPKQSPTPSPSASPSPSGRENNSTLSQPSPLPSPLPGGPIDIPEESPLPNPAP